MKRRSVNTLKLRTIHHKYLLLREEIAKWPTESPSPGPHRVSKRIGTLFLAFEEEDSSHQRGNKLCPCPTSVLFLGILHSSNTFQPILRATPFPRLFPSPQQERSQRAGCRGKTPGVCAILSLSMQQLRQLNLRHNGRKQQPWFAESSQHAAREISTRPSWKGSKHTCCISSGSSRSTIRGFRRQMATDLLPLVCTRCIWHLQQNWQREYLKEGLGMGEML